MPVQGSDTSNNLQFEYEQYLVQQQTTQQNEKLNNIEQGSRKDPAQQSEGGVQDPLVFGSVPEAPQEPPPQH